MILDHHPLRHLRQHDHIRESSDKREFYIFFLQIFHVPPNLLSRTSINFLGQLEDKCEGPLILRPFGQIQPRLVTLNQNALLFKKFHGWVWSNLYLYISLFTSLSVQFLFLFSIFSKKLCFYTFAANPDNTNGHLRVPWEGLLILLLAGITATELMDSSKISRSQICSLHPWQIYILFYFSFSTLSSLESDAILHQTLRRRQVWFRMYL